MRLLTPFLYSVLICCFIYALVYWSGALIFKQMVKFYFGESVSLEKVSISPKLELRIGRVDYNFGEPGLVSNYNGFIRAVDVNWALLGTRPFLSISAGYIEDKSAFKLHKASFVLEPSSVTNWSDSVFRIEASDFETPFGFGLGLLKSEGMANLKNSTLGPTYFKLENLSHEDLSFTANYMEGNLSELSYLKILELPPESLSIRASNFQLESFQAETVEGNLRLRRNGKSYGISAHLPLLTVGKDIMWLSNLIVESEIDVLTLDLSNKFDFTANGLGSSFLDLKLKDISGAYAQNDYQLKSSVQGIISQLELSKKQQFIGRLADFDFNLDLEAKKNESSWAISQIGYLSPNASPEIKLNSKIALKLTEQGNFIDCISTTCDFTDVDADFRLVTDDNVAVLTISCETYLCDDSAASGVITTSNTIKILNAIADTKFFNPFFLALVASEISQGRRLGDGHELIFPLK